MADLFPPSIDDQIACVKRELGYRLWFYERRVDQGKMTRQVADRELERMAEVLKTLEGVRDGSKAEA